MSHLKERKEKKCLNCNALIYGRFCHICGQENLIPKETFLYLVRHFIEDLTLFDGKFFATLKYLLLRPDFLSYEYMRGRRLSYLNPIRMYVFTSAIFSFLLSFVRIGAFFYTYKAIRNFYHQGRFKSFIKCFDLYFFFTCILGICLALFNYTTFLNSH